MANVKRLKGEAMESAEWRGHTMEAWVMLALPGRIVHDAKCQVCGAWVRVDPAPPPNGIDVGGPAVAVNC
jgi:hypothetical protein